MDNEELAFAKDQIQHLIVECENKARWAQCKANLFRLLNISVSLLIIVTGSIIGVVSSVQPEKNYIAIVLGFGITTIQTVHDLFRLGHRGIFYKYASLRLRNILHSARESLIALHNGKDLLRFSNHMQREIDDLDFTMFKISYGPDNIKSSDTQRSFSFSSAYQRRKSSTADTNV